MSKWRGPRYRIKTITINLLQISVINIETNGQKDAAVTVDSKYKMEYM